MVAADSVAPLRSWRWQQQIASLGHDAVKAASLPFTADLPAGFSVLSLNNRSYCCRRIPHCLKTLPVYSNSVKTLPVCKSSVKTLPVCRSSTKTLPVCRSSVKALPVCRSSTKTLPVCRSSTKTLPVCRSSTKTLPVCRSSTKTLPVCRSSTKTLPVYSSSGKEPPCILIAWLLWQSATCLICLACVCRMAYVEKTPWSSIDIMNFLISSTDLKSASKFTLEWYSFWNRS